MTTVRIFYCQGDDGWWAESPDMDGFAAAGESLAEVRGLVREGVPFYLEQDDVQYAEVYPLVIKNDYDHIQLTASPAATGRSGFSAEARLRIAAVG